MKTKFSQGFWALFLGRMTQFVGYSLIGLFLPIFLLITFGRLEWVVIYYLVGHLLYALFLPLGAQELNKIGLRRSLKVSVFLFAGYYVCLFLFNVQAINIIWLVAVALLVLTLGRTLFWLPFHTDLAKFTNIRNRGQSVGLLWATKTFLGVVMPVISGFLLARFGYNIVFWLAIIIYLSSLIPFAWLPRTRERYEWGYWQTWREYFKRSNRKLVLANMANGAENVVGIVIWPIFIWQILHGNYFAVGAVSSLIVLATIVLQLAVGRFTDKLNKRKMIHWGSALYASGWLAKMFVLTAFQIFIVGTYHSFTQIFKDTPFDALNYEVLADHGHYVDEYTVLKEIAVQLGKVLMLIFIFLLVVAANFNLSWTFALAALASLLINFL
jgi:YQGE family putative transporter